MRNFNLIFVLTYLLLLNYALAKNEDANKEEKKLIIEVTNKVENCKIKSENGDILHMLA